MFCQDHKAYGVFCERSRSAGHQLDFLHVVEEPHQDQQYQIMSVSPD